MKRKATGTDGTQKLKRPLPDYCDITPQRDEGGIIWPAPRKAIEDAQAFLRECAASRKKALIVPDKDADGLNAGVIVHRTLTMLGHSPDLIEVHLVAKGSNIHEEKERVLMRQKEARYIIVVDQGSRAGPPVVDDGNASALIIDHHQSDEFPENALVVSACHYPPVATSALLTYEICRPLHPDIAEKCAYLCAMGTHGDLGTALKWKPPFPDLTSTFKEHKKKNINDAVSLINAPRRRAKFDVVTAWEALLATNGPKELLDNKRLLEARAEVNDEIARHTHAPPKFSRDGKIAVIRISSAAQVHPVIATRWANHLQSKAIEIVLVANLGYIPGMVNFSCRVARRARNRDPPVNIIASLKAVAGLSEGDLVARMGENFARGHKEASGGIVPVAEFEELMELLGIGKRPAKAEGEGPKKNKKEGAVQENSVTSYFTKK